MDTLTAAPMEAGFQETLQKIIESEVARVKREELRETDLTMDRVILKYRLSYHQARNLLKTLVERGLVQKIRVQSDDSSSRVAWRPVETQKG